MRARRSIGIVALLGVLLHAGALVRHHGVMLGATLQHQALVNELAQICHAAGTTADVSTSNLPAIPKPSDAQNGCPLCSGLGSAFALLGPEPPAVPLPLPAAAPDHSCTVAAPAATYAVCPPARGPPAFA